MKLKQEVKHALTEEMKMKLAVRLGKSFSTINNWIREDSEKLTMLKVIEEIEKLTGYKNIFRR